MPQHIVIVDRKRDFPWPAPDRLIILARDYLINADWASQPAVHVINLCRDYSYLSLGYYSSLLAEARGHKVIPSTEVMLDLHWKRLLRIALPEINELLKRTFKAAPEEQPPFTVDIFFRIPDDPRLAEVARRAFELFRSPILSLNIRYRNGWKIHSVGTKSVKELRPEQQAPFLDALDRFTLTAWRDRRTIRQSRYTIAVLHDPLEQMPPSNAQSLKKFQRAGAKLGVEVALITRHDYTRLPQFDALLIRETTSLDHYTYRFAKKAVAEGMPVIDDPRSILRCTNKIYLAELLRINRVPTPKTLVVERRGVKRAAKELGFPLVIKIPDGSFSRGVFKALNPEDLLAASEYVLKDSDLAIVQEFLPTEFDWRIGILDRKPLYACQYYMAKGHWQIIKHGRNGRTVSGRFRTFDLSEVPAAVIDVALHGASLIGDGLYGVDVKETPRGAYVIEINDNPNIDAGVEDAVLKDALYKAILGSLISRLEDRTRAPFPTDQAPR